MAVNPVTGASNVDFGGVAKKDQLGQAQFMQLMIAQLRNQDPTQPMDPANFLGQLAQFGTVSGIQGMQDSISTLSDSLRSSQVLGGTSLVGHYVLADASEGEIVGGSTPADVTRPTCRLSIDPGRGARAARNGHRGGGAGSDARGSAGGRANTCEAFRRAIS